MESEHGCRIPAAALPVCHDVGGGGGAGAGDLHFFLLLQPGAVNIRRLDLIRFIAVMRRIIILDRIRIQIIFVFQNQPNTNTNNIRFPKSNEYEYE